MRVQGSSVYRPSKTSRPEAAVPGERGAAEHQIRCLDNAPNPLNILLVQLRSNLHPRGNRRGTSCLSEFSYSEGQVGVCRRTPARWTAQPSSAIPSTPSSMEWMTPVNLHRAWLTGAITDEQIEARYPSMVAKHLIARRRRVLASLHELRGKNLACWCSPSRACHAELLLELVNRPRTLKAAESHVPIASRI
jgi:hypothetical protein